MKAEPRMKEEDLPTVSQFLDVLNGAQSEEEVQQFLTTNHVVVSGGWERCTIIPKLRLGSDFVTDFVATAGASGTVYATLIELEPPNQPVFTKDRKPARRLADALRQVSEWRHWIRENERYFIECLKKEAAGKGLPGYPGGPSEYWESYHRRKYSYVIIIGRRENMSERDLQSRAALLDQMSDVEIVSYDRLVDRLRDLWDSKSQRPGTTRTIHGSLF